MSEKPFRRGPDPTPDELLGALRSAGWLLEQETLTIARDVGWSAIPNWAFKDLDEPSVSRELDVYGYRKVYTNEDTNFTVHAFLLAECKQHAMPYALLGQNISPLPMLRPHEEQVFLRPRVRTGRTTDPRTGVTTEHSAPAHRYLRFDHLTANPWAVGFEATQIVHLEKNNGGWLANNDDIFNKFVYPMAKVVTTLAKGAKEHNNHRSNTFGSIHLYFPLLVTSASLHRVDAGATPPEVASAPWVRLVRRIESEHVTGTFRLTVVNFEHLRTYLATQVEPFISAVVEEVKKDPVRVYTQEDFTFKE